MYIQGSAKLPCPCYELARILQVGVVISAETRFSKLGIGNLAELCNLVAVLSTHQGGFISNGE